MQPDTESKPLHSQNKRLCILDLELLVQETNNWSELTFT